MTEGGGMSGIWIISPLLEQYVMTAKDDEGRDLWNDNTSVWGLPKIRNYPYLVNHWLGVKSDGVAVDPEAGATTGYPGFDKLELHAAFGDFSYYLHLQGANGDMMIFPFWDSNTSPAYELVACTFATGGPIGAFNETATELTDAIKLLRIKNA